MGIKSLIIDGIEYIPKPSGGGYGCLGSIGLAFLFLLLLFGGNDDDGKKDEFKSGIKTETKSKGQTKTDEEKSNTIVWENDTDNSSIEDNMDERIPEQSDNPVQDDEEPIDKANNETSSETLIGDGLMDIVISHNQDIL